MRGIDRRADSEITLFIGEIEITLFIGVISLASSAFALGAQ